MFHTPELNTKGFWEITDAREAEKIYSGYAARYHQVFPAQVCVVLIVMF